MSRRFALAIAVCLHAVVAGTCYGQYVGPPIFDALPERLPPLDETTGLPPMSVLAPQPELIAPGTPTPASPNPAAPSAATPDEAKVILEEPGWHVWSPTFWDPWEGNVELGLSGTEGNSQTFNVRFGMTARHKTPTFVQTLQVTSIQKSADGVTTANTALIDGRLEWPMPESRWNYFIHGLWEYDEFKAFAYRISGDTGLGFEFIQTDTTTLIGRSGLAVSHEVGGPNDAWNPELLFGGEFKHKFNPTHTISAKVDYYPTITAWGDFRLNSQASWEIALSQAWGLSLKLSVIDRYDSTPEGAKPNDLDYSTLLLWTF
jgi:putative salt-induced outer membrane protein YdiY